MTPALTRMLKVTTEQGIKDVPVRLLWPVQGRASWECRWEIDWPGASRSNVGRGADGVQALIHALMMIGTEVYSSAPHQAGQLSWTDDWSGYGFPVPGGMRDVMIGDDAANL